MKEFVLTALLFTAVLAGGCTEKGDVENTETPVTVYVLESSAISETVNIHCRLESSTEAVVSLSFPGIVEEVLVSPGDTVKYGERLVSLRSDDGYRAMVSDAAAVLSVAGASREFAEENLRRAEQLSENGAISANELQRIETEAAAAEASFQRASAGYTVSASSARSGYVTAPFDGVVGRVFATDGNMVSGPLLTVSGAGVVKAELLAAPRHIHKLRVGLPVVFTTDHFPGSFFPGSIVSVAEMADPLSGMVAMTAQFPDSSGKLVPGLTGAAVVMLETRENAVVVPAGMMTFIEGNKMEVALVENGIAAIRQVETGIRNGVYYEIVTGLTQGDTLIDMGHTLVSDGSPVRVVQ
jgi:RND family efflux transporter MFP subunit